MARTIEIKVTGEAGSYEATVQRMIEKNAQLNKSAIQGAEQVTAIYLRMQSVLSGIGGQLAGFVGVGAFIGFAKQAVDAAGKLQDLADQTKISAQLLSGLKTPLEQSGVSVEDFANGVVRLQKSLVDSRDKQDGFALRMRDLLKLSSDPEKFLEGFAKKLAEIKNPAEQTAFALEAASRGGAKLAPILIQIAEQGLDKFRQAADGMSNETIAKLDELGDSFTGFKNTMLSAFGTGIGALGEFSGAVRQFGTVVGSTIAFVLQHKDAILLLGAGVAALTGHWIAAAAALATYLGLASNYRGDLGQLNALNEKELKIQQQLLAVEEARRKGQRSGASSDLAYNAVLAQQSAIALQKQELIDKLRQDNDKPAVKSTSPLGPGTAAAEQALKNADAVAQLKKEIEQANVAIVKASAVEGQYSQAVHDAELALIAQEKAEKITSAEKDKTIGATRGYIDQLAETKIKLLEATEAANKHKDALKLLAREIENEKQAESDLAAVLEAKRKGEEELKQRKLDAIDLEQQLANSQGDRLSAIGQTTQAERVRLLAQIQYLQKIKEIEDATPGGKDTSLRVAQIQTAQTQLQQLGVASVNVGHAIADTLNDIFTAAIQGTLKFSDIGKSLLAGVARTAGDFFTQILNKKLGFENLILSNVNQLPGQINNAFTSGAAGLPGGQSNGGGGLLNSFGGGGQGGGGGGIGGLLQGGIGNLLGNIFSNGGTTGFGSAPAGVAGPSMANGGFFSNPVGAFQAGGGSFFSGGAAIGGGLLSNLLNAGWQGQLGSVLGNIVGSLAASTAIGTAVTSSIATALGSVLGATLGGLLAGMVIPGIGAIIGVLISLLFKHVPNPTVFVKTVLGFFYDQSLQAFGFFESATITKALEIKGSKAKQVLADHQKILQDLGDKFSDLLNIFPTTVQEIIAAQMEDANRVLTDIFGSKKYTDLGSRNIKRELDDLKNKEGPLGFFVALRGALGAGLAQTLNLAGFGGLTDLVNRQLPLPPNPTPRDFPFRGGAGGLLPPEGVEEFGKFIDAMGKFIGFTATLANISPRGIQPFLTDQDKAAVQAQIAGVLLSPGDDFAKAVDDMLDRVKPIADFLEKSVTEASDLFGKGLIAAMEAVTASEANTAFLKNIGEGVKDKIFSGITEAFIASAQFTDLLAPIQQIIRQFTQDALATGQTPDIGAFRAALFPAIEDISTRAESLRPLIEALQALGFDVTHALESLIGSGTVGGGNNITINIENFNREDDPQQLARNIQDLLNGRTAP